MDLHETDRIYKIIDAQIGPGRFMRILSKIDSLDKVTIEFYFYSAEDIDKESGIVKNKESRYEMVPIDVSEFDEIISKFPLIFHGFKILEIRDYHNMTLDEAVKDITSKGYGKLTDIDDEDGDEYE